MRTILSTSILILILLSFSCENKSKDQSKLTFEEVKKVIITGRIFPFQEGKSSLTVAVDRIGKEQEDIITDIDEQGYFQLSFETAVPTDLWVVYNTNFSLVAVPGDSMHVEWDGTKSDRPAILETVEVFSKKSNVNEGVLAYQKEYFASNNYSALFNENKDAYQQLDSKEYRLFADSLHT